MKFILFTVFYKIVAGEAIKTTVACIPNHTVFVWVEAERTTDVNLLNKIATPLHFSYLQVGHKRTWR